MDHTVLSGIPPPVLGSAVTAGAVEPLLRRPFGEHDVSMLVPRWVCRVMIVIGALGALEACAGMALEEPFRWRSLAWLLAFVVPLYAVGVLAYLHRSDLPIARLLVLVGGLWAAPGPYTVYLLHGAEPRLWPVYLVTGMIGLFAIVATATLVALYPDGRYHRGYERVAVRTAWSLTTIAALAFIMTAPDIPIDLEHVDAAVSNPLQIGSQSGPVAGEQLFGVAVPLLPLAAVVLLALRYRRSDPQARRRIRWLLVVPIAVAAVATVTLLVEISGVEQEWFGAVGAVAEYALLALIPLVLWMSILRHQLLDVDVVIRKSAVYAVLWVLIAATYLAVAAGIGVASSQLLPVTMVVLLTMVATLAFQPVRRALERLADRWVFGRRLRGYALLGHLGAQLETTVDQSEVPAGIAETVRVGLRLEWARVVVHLRSDGGPNRALAADSGVVTGAPAERIPLVFGDEPLGVIECGPSLAGGITDEDRQVLVTLARQAAFAVNNARLTAELEARLSDIRAQADELAASRARIVHAADAERRRIERDLHDGAQQQLVALMAGLQLARNQLRRHPDRADSTLAGLQAEAAALHHDVLELTRGIHPPVLTDRGLAEALQSRAERLPVEVAVDVPADLRTVRFANEIEGAAYFVAAEAVTNVLKHARARRVVISMSADDGDLQLRVADDGCGFDQAAANGAGHGLVHMADRVEALGGRLVVTTQPGSGCEIEAYLPARGRTDG